MSDVLGSRRTVSWVEITVLKLRLEAYLKQRVVSKAESCDYQHCRGTPIAHDLPEHATRRLKLSLSMHTSDFSKQSFLRRGAVRS